MKPIKILVTAGPTREPIDPVRFISNYSTGAMGYAIAVAARKRGHSITLVAGPTRFLPPEKIKIVPVTTADEMFKAVKVHYKPNDCIIMAAAISDFRPILYYKDKLKRTAGPQGLRLCRNPDILYWLGRKKAGQLLVGFCMETKNLILNAKKKMALKKLDIIIANKIDKKKSAFGAGKTDVIILSSSGQKARLNSVTKERVASILLDKIEKLWYKRNPKD